MKCKTWPNQETNGIYKQQANKDKDKRDQKQRNMKYARIKAKRNVETINIEYTYIYRIVKLVTNATRTYNKPSYKIILLYTYTKLIQKPNI